MIFVCHKKFSQDRNDMYFFQLGDKEIENLNCLNSILIAKSSISKEKDACPHGNITLDGY